MKTSNSYEDETLVVYTVYDADQHPLFRFWKKKSGGCGKKFSSPPPEWVDLARVNRVSNARSNDMCLIKIGPREHAFFAV
jgi:hypothetical protein